MTDNRDFLRTEPVGKLLLKLAIPTVTAQVINMLYNIVDRVYIGHIPEVGATALTGVGVCMPLIMIVTAFAALAGFGGAPRASIFMGKGDKDFAEKTMGNSFTALLIISVLLTCALLIWNRDFLMAFGASENTIEYGVSYMNIYALGTIFVQLTLGMNAFITAQGFATTGMLSVLIGAVANIILDPIFIFAMGMGVKGAALATVISQAMSCAWVIVFLSGKRTHLKLRLPNMRLKYSIIMPSLALGLSTFVMQASESVISVCFNSSLLKYGGDLALGANGIITSVTMLIVMLIIGIAQGMLPIVGFNYGAGQFRRVQETLRLVIITSTVIMGIGCVANVAFPEWIASAFTRDADLLAVTANGLRITLLVFIVVGSQISISQFFQSIGIAWKAIFLSLSRQLLFLVPAILLFSRVWGLDGVWYAAPFSDFVAAVTAWIFLWQHVKNMKKKGLN